jgi:hypothetical protein
MLVSHRASLWYSYKSSRYEGETNLFSKYELNSYGLGYGSLLNFINIIMNLLHRKEDFLTS